MRRILRSILDEIMSKWTDFKEEPMEIIERAIPALIIAISVLSGVLLWIKFIIQGGYTKQIHIIQKKGFDEAFVYPDLQSKIWNVMCVGTSVLFLTAIAIMLVLLFMKSAVWKKVVMTITLCLLSMISFATYFVYKVIHFMEYAFTGITLNEKQTNEILGRINGVKVEFPLKQYAITICVLVCVFIVLLLLEETRGMLLKSFVAIVASYLLVPLSLFLLENIIPLLFTIAVAAVAILIVFLVLGGSSSEEKFLVTVRDGVVDSIHKISER